MRPSTRRTAAVAAFFAGALSLFLGWRVCRLFELEGLAWGVCGWRILVGVALISIGWGLWRGTRTGT